MTCDVKGGAETELTLYGSRLMPSKLIRVLYPTGIRTGSGFSNRGQLLFYNTEETENSGKLNLLKSTLIYGNFLSDF